MPEGYSTHHDYIEKLQEGAAARQANIEIALREAFASFIERREVEVVEFSGMTVFDLSAAIQSHPVILKGIVACCNIGARALARDLGLTVDTYVPKMSPEKAAAIAGYVKPFLPPYLEIPAISYVDKLWYIDKEMRKGKGNWEKLILNAANESAGNRVFRKIKFVVDNQEFELDAAHQSQDGAVLVGIDVKRIESPRDIHKRSDEILTKAGKLKAIWPEAKFGAVVYYPFLPEQANLQNRLRSANIDGLVFAAESVESVNRNVRLLLSMLGIDAE